MTMTQETENLLVSMLKSGSVSIPKLQYELHIPYRDACSLIKYALDCKWIGECTEGNEFPIIASDFARKDVPNDFCKTVYDKLRGDDLKILYYLGERFNATLSDILADVDDDEDDMRCALDRLIASRLIFKHEQYFYCKLSARSVATIKKCGENEGATNKTSSRIWDFLDDD